MTTITIEINGITYTITALNSAGMGRIARFSGSGWYTDEQIVETAKQFPEDVTVTEASPEPVPTVNPVVEALDRKIQTYEAKLETIGNQITRRAYELNPEFDMGGIRSRSAKRKEKMRNGIDNAHRQYMETNKQCAEYKSMKTEYLKACKIVADLPPILETGVYPSGNPMTKEQRKRGEKLLKQNRKVIASIEHKIAIWRLHEKEAQ